MVNFLNLETAKTPDMQVDWNGATAPLRNALAGYRDGMNQQYAETQRKEQQTYDRGRVAKSDADQQKAIWGKRALAVDQIQDPNQRKAIWGRIVTGLGSKDLTPEELDPMTGPKLMAAEAGLYNDPRDSRAKDLELQYKEAQIGKLNREDEPDPVETMLMERLRGSRPQQPVQQPQAPTLQPQSFQGGQSRDPMLLNVADEAPQAAPAPEPETIETPYGRMSRQEAMELGGAMLLQPKRAAAGKALLDAAQGGGAGGLGKAGENTVDEKAIGMVDLAGRLDAISGRFKPEYQTYETSAKMYGLSWLDSFNATRGSINPQDRAKFEEYTAFRQDATNNLSEYIKYITGAAMGIQEEGRIRKGMPDPEKDSPSQFEAKTRNAVAQTKLALARYNYLKRKGYDEKTIQSLARTDKIGEVAPLQGMQGIINQRLDQAAQELKGRNPKIDDMSLKRALRGIQRQEFGI